MTKRKKHNDGQEDFTNWREGGNCTRHGVLAFRESNVVTVPRKVADHRFIVLLARLIRANIGVARVDFIPTTTPTP
jgi:hypothetical protein